MERISFHCVICGHFQEPVGCVSEILVSNDKGLPVEFKDEDASQQPSLCWETCKTVVNASLALLGTDISSDLHTAFMSKYLHNGRGTVSNIVSTHSIFNQKYIIHSCHKGEYIPGVKTATANILSAILSMDVFKAAISIAAFDSF